jgi:uncharacterized coiled-coil protein SlyX
VRDRKD